MQCSRAQPGSRSHRLAEELALETELQFAVQFDEVEEPREVEEKEDAGPQVPTTPDWFVHSCEGLTPQTVVSMPPASAPGGPLVSGTQQGTHGFSHWPLATLHWGVAENREQSASPWHPIHCPVSPTSHCGVEYGQVFSVQLIMHSTQFPDAVQ